MILKQEYATKNIGDFTLYICVVNQMWEFEPRRGTTLMGTELISITPSVESKYLPKSRRFLWEIDYKFWEII